MSDPIPAIINRKAGTAAEAARVLAEVGGFELHEVEPERIRATALEIVARKPKRILVCGGDGSLCTVAHVIAKTGIELAIVPGGTLNHLAKHLGLPEDLREAAIVAQSGITRTLDAGRVNSALFLNTSSVGAYERFVRHRDRLEKWWGYHLASVIAGVRILIRTPLSRVIVEVDGVERVYRTPLVFVGVGERELRIPSLGGRMDHGERGLHLMIVRHRTGARLAALALQAAARGSDAMARTPAMDSVVVDRCSIELATDTASIDGELITVEPPLEYEFIQDALVVVVGERREEARPSP
ncbi:MAG TPA: diacylglycerol kinase family protein [Gemmatimonadaceae bacterium]|nr:diacylglycerol kinase family protein [Gemmatimonadaceae bacterium]